MTYGVCNQIISSFFNCNYQCLYLIIYPTLFIIVALVLLYLLCSVNVCHVFVCICLYRDHSGNKCLHVFGSSLYLMYFVFIFMYICTMFYILY